MDKSRFLRQALTDRNFKKVALLCFAEINRLKFAIFERSSNQSGTNLIIIIYHNRSTLYATPEAISSQHEGTLVIGPSGRKSAALASIQSKSLLFIIVCRLFTLLRHSVKPKQRRLQIKIGQNVSVIHVLKNILNKLQVTGPFSTLLFSKVDQVDARKKVHNKKFFTSTIFNKKIQNQLNNIHLSFCFLVR